MDDELANVIERAVALCSGDQIQPEDLPPLNPVPSTPSSLLPPQITPGQFHPQVKGSKQAVIKAASRQTGSDQTKAAERLGLRRTYLVRLLRALGIREQERSPP
jgi:DNA-binding NtrC family response regulator